MTAANEIAKLPETRRTFVMSRNRAAYEEYLDSAERLLPLEAKTKELQKFDEEVQTDLIIGQLNIAADNPTAENLSAARDMIDGSFTDEADRWRYLQVLRSLTGRQKTLKNATYQAQLQMQAGNMVTAYTNGQIYDGEVLPEMAPINTQFQNRTANGTMNTGDGLTYEFLKDDITSGYHVDDMDLISAYASGLSTDEYKELTELNAQNRKLTPVQTQQMATFSEYATTEYQNLKKSMAGRTPPHALAELETAIQQDTQIVKEQIRQSIRDGEPSEIIYKKIQKHFASTSDTLVKGAWGRTFNTRADELKADIYELTDREDRYTTIMNLYKSNDDKDKARLKGLLNRWYAK